MIRIIRSDPTHPDFVALVHKLDEYLAVLDGEEHEFYHKLNTIGNLKYVVMAYEDEVAVGCGAIKQFGADAMEVKRMYVELSRRGMGIGVLLLTELERWTKELGHRKCVLETGRRQPEAIRLYEKCGYERIPNYGQYFGMENSVCFEKGWGD
ncbi:MAG: GNAT family N-acetyltransferase [Cyclobacteriaceae bacterium]|nr:GNAT family N-acetyltransferase [Cyclobacteriaceae bacterium]